MITAFDAPLLLFLLSAAGGVWIAYDRSAAWTKFGLIVGGLALYSVLARTRSAEHIHWGQGRKLPVLQWTLGSLPTLVAVYFFLTNDWASRIGKVAWLDPAMRWFAAWQLSLPGLRLNSNVIGGVLAAFLPLQVAALLQDHMRSRALTGLLVGLSSLGLLMSASRGAWLALVVVAGVWGLWKLLGRLAGQQTMSGQQIQAVWAVAIAGGLVACALMLMLTPLGERLLALRSDRLAVWRNSLDLASDYPFTGLGLGNFEMAYSSYVLLVHVPHTAHAHNLFLDIWLEQGLLGLLALASLVIRAAGSNGVTSRWRPAALASLGVILLHGLLDDAFFGYGARAAPLMFLPLALLARTEVPAALQHNGPRHASSILLFWGLAAIMLLAAALWPAAQAAFKANLGAVAQARAELTGYHWPESVYQDVVRRSTKTNLAPAIAWYQSALRTDPANATANRRLGQIELSFEQLDAARSHLQAAYAVAPGQRATRQLLGECYALAGEVEPAVVLWRTIDISERQLELRQWWYAEYLGDPVDAARLSQAVSALNR